MKQSCAFLVVAIFGLPVLAQDKPAKDQVTDKMCVAGRASATSALVEGREVGGQIAPPGAGEPPGLLATLGQLEAQADDRWYLFETAWLSATMTRQGTEVAIARLNPRFATRLAGAIREARGSGLPFAGIFSAYRPPSFGVGRFLDRFNSLHAYGLAVDMRGIGDPGSKEARLWYDIAGRHGIVCPYGVGSRREWNHCQPTPAKAVCRDDPLRKTITAEGPIDLAEMFKVGDGFVANPPTTCTVVAANRPAGAEVITPNIAAPTTDDTRAASGALSAYSDRKELGGALSVAMDAVPPHEAHAAFARSDREHAHEAHDTAVAALARSRRSSDEALTRMVAHDMALEPSHPKTRRRR